MMYPLLFVLMIVVPATIAAGIYQLATLATHRVLRFRAVGVTMNNLHSVVVWAIKHTRNEKRLYRLNTWAERLDVRRYHLISHALGESCHDCMARFGHDPFVSNVVPISPYLEATRVNNMRQLRMMLANHPDTIA